MFIYIILKNNLKLKSIIFFIFKKIYLLKIYLFKTIKYFFD